MKKNPAECKNSMRFGDVYICKLQTVPCAALNKCALDQVGAMVKAMKELIELSDEQTKEV